MPTAEIARFWEETRAQLAEVPMEATVERIESMSETNVSTHMVTLTSFEHRKIRAWYTLPDGVPQRGWPGVMVVPGYGGFLAVPGFLARFGYASLTLYPRGQGESLQEWQLEHSTRLTYNVTDKERYYYRGAYMDCIRGLDFLASRSEVDTSRLAVWGASQGGGLSLATASLDHRPIASVAGVPWLCNFPLAAEVTANPYVELYDYLQQHPQDRAAAMETLTYFDQLNLADDIACPTLVSAAIIDEVHPYNTIMPVFEKLPAMKSIVVYPDREHGHAVDFASHGMAWLQRYLC